MAHARLGHGNRAVELLRLLNPVEHARTVADVERYRVEPYVVAADVYRLEGFVGRGGWTWYTGSSGWLYRTWIEEVLGVKREGDRLRVRPILHSDWRECTVWYRWGETGATVYEIRIQQDGAMPEGRDGHLAESGTRVEVDGEAIAGDGWIRLRDDGAHHTVRVRVASAVPSQTAANSLVPGSDRHMPGASSDEAQTPNDDVAASSIGGVARSGSSRTQSPRSGRPGSLSGRPAEPVESRDKADLGPA
jgi:cyclic beta-1,2-glucan synthetase